MWLISIGFLSGLGLAFTVQGAVSHAKPAGGAKAGKSQPSTMDQVVKIANPQVVRQVDKELVCGLMGFLLGTSSRRR